MAVKHYYLMGDQPTTCPICGARTDLISDFFHTRLAMGVNECMNSRCAFIFLEVADEGI